MLPSWPDRDGRPNAASAGGTDIEEPPEAEPAPAPPMAVSPPALPEDEAPAPAPALLDDPAVAADDNFPRADGKSCEEFNTTVDPPAARAPRLEEAALEVPVTTARPPRAAADAGAELRSVDELRAVVATGAGTAFAAPVPLGGTGNTALPAFRLARSDIAFAATNETRSNRHLTATLL